MQSMKERGGGGVHLCVNIAFVSSKIFELSSFACFHFKVSCSNKGLRAEKDHKNME